VIAEIGRGAASIIYLVQDKKTKQVWALKHIEKNDAKDQRFLDQATTEFEVAQKVANSRVRHIEKVVKGRKNLLAVKDLFLVMEYVDGIAVERHPPTNLAEAMNIFIQTADGLACMHEAGFVHADMKPNNIVVNEDGGVKIIDLGQACAIGTIKERIQGTPQYIAPEQVHRREITPQTDVYNLGATMYWVLTGQHIPTAMPQDGDSLMGQLDDRFIEKATPVIELNTGVPQELSDLVEHCVQVDPEERPSLMREIESLLRSIDEAIATPTAGTDPAIDADEPAE
jgi:serine/threonine-protein kinase